MAESADILKTKDQMVLLPDLGAGCDMADMAHVADVQDAWAELTEIVAESSVLPITYINSTAALKAFVGAKGGVVCTSTNAQRIVKWALDQNKKIFFFPDQHLGRNTCKALGIALEKMALWDPELLNGGLSRECIEKTEVYLWKGHCPVHMMFSAKQVHALRAKDPNIKIVAHPECSADVVDLADAVGSTEFIVQTISSSPPGSRFAVGTEMNLVNRIAEENPDKTVISINPFMCLCGTMNRIDLAHLAWALESLRAGNAVNVISVADPERSLAKKALDRMLQLSV